MTTKSLDLNYKFVIENMEKLLENFNNKFILVHNRKVINSFDTYGNALEEGIRLFGLNKGFLIHHVIEEPVNFVMGASF